MNSGTFGLEKKFELQDLLGSGGFAEVYKAVRKEDNLTVALKLPRISGFQTTSANFVKEVANWKNLKHPGIVPLLEFGQTPVPYIAMEFMPGGSLRSRIGSLTIPQALTIAAQLADALFYAHRHGLVHLDVKPENILFDAEGNARLSDWGLSRVMLASSAGSVVSLSTAFYAAPEQFVPGKQYGGRDWQTDIWQFGATLYEMVTGRLPFPAQDMMELMHKILEEEPVAIGQASPDLDVRAELDRLIARCLKKDKKERFDDFHPIRNELQSLLTAPKPKASYEASPLSGYAPLKVGFRDTSTGPVSSWRWDFGDGVTSTEQHPAHVFTNAGSFKTSLTVRGAGGSDGCLMSNKVVVSPVASEITPAAVAPPATEPPLSTASLGRPSTAKPAAALETDEVRPPKASPDRTRKKVTVALVSSAAVVLILVIGVAVGPKLLQGELSRQSTVTTPTPSPTPKPPISKEAALTVSPGKSGAYFVSVDSGDRLTGTFTISGGSGNDISFLIKDPTGNTVLTVGRVSTNWQFDFVCLFTGSYQLVFDNSFSSVSNKAVNLNLKVYPKN
ncbi:MAG: protein kinase [Chloroflexi bacterium]|nr:protein kinase [Chloroflexota bacterium]